MEIFAIGFFLVLLAMVALVMLASLARTVLFEIECGETRALETLGTVGLVALAIVATSGNAESWLMGASAIIPLASLKGALKALKVTGSTRSTLAILSHVLITAREGKGVELMSTDLDNWVYTSVECEVSEPFEVALPYKGLAELCKSKGDATLELEHCGTWVKVTRNGATSRINGTHCDDFPSQQGAPKDQIGSLDPATFINALKQVSVTMSKDHARPNLVGTYMVCNGTTCELVATDGHRLNIASFESTLNFEGTILNAQGIKALLSGLAIKGDTIKVSPLSRTHGDGGLVFEQGATQFCVGAIGGSFPDFRQVIPKPSPDLARVNRKALLDAIVTVSAYSHTKTSNIRLSFEGSQIELYATDPDKGEIVAYVACDYSGPAVKAGFNFRYLVDACKALASEEIVISLIDTLSPCQINGDEGDVTCVVMPMRL